MSRTQWERLSDEKLLRSLRKRLARAMRSKCVHGEESGEIGWFRIEPDPLALGLSKITVDAGKGPREFRQARETAGTDPQSDDYPRPGGATAYEVFGEQKESLVQAILALDRDPKKSQERRFPTAVTEDHESSPHAVIATLEDAAASHAARRRMVIEAEVLPFGPAERSRLNAVLCRFIQDHRNSDDPEDLVAVASAIRKYVATMDGGDLGDLAVLLASDQNATVPLEVELEVAKTLVRKLVSQPPEEPDSEPELGDRLMELASTYLNARLLSREKYGAVALNVVLALLLLRSRHVADLLAVLRNLRVPWFTQLVVRRARRVRDDFEHRFPVAQAERCVGDLDALCKEFAATEV